MRPSPQSRGSCLSALGRSAQVTAVRAGPVSDSNKEDAHYPATVTNRPAAAARNSCNDCPDHETELTYETHRSALGPL